MLTSNTAFEMCYKLHDSTDSRPWECLGGRFKSSPVIVSMDANTIDVFGLDVNNNVLHKCGTGSGTEITSWSPPGTEWENMGVFDSPPSAVSPAPNRIDVCATVASGAIYHNSCSSGVWRYTTGNWKNVADSSSGAPVLASSTPGNVEVWTVDYDKVYCKILNTATDEWTTWHYYGSADVATNVAYNGYPPPYVAAYTD